MAKRIAKESAQHLEAFRFYASLGPGRKLSEVGRRFAVSETSVQQWARSFDWARRAAQHDAGVGKRTREIVQRDDIDQDAKAKAQNLNLLHLLKMKIAKAVAEDDVNLRASDLVALMRLEQSLLEGDAAKGRAEQPGEGPPLEGLSIEELWEQMAQEVAAFNRLAESSEEVQGLLKSGRIKPLPVLMKPNFSHAQDPSDDA
jgi:hypothetical protein